MGRISSCVAVILFFLLLQPTRGISEESATSLELKALSIEPLTKQGPHGGRILHTPQGDFEVVLNPTQKVIDLYSLQDSNDDLPQRGNMELWLRGQQVQMPLRAVEAWEGKQHYRTAPFRATQPITDLDSMMGLQLRFPIKKSNTTKSRK
jgi:hypothetical protein